MGQEVMFVGPWSRSSSTGIVFRRSGDKLQVQSRGTLGGHLLPNLLASEPGLRGISVSEKDFNYSVQKDAIGVYEAVVPEWTALINFGPVYTMDVGLVHCYHDWEEKLLFTGSYKQCKLCGVTE